MSTISSLPPLPSIQRHAAPVDNRVIPSAPDQTMPSAIVTLSAYGLAAADNSDARMQCMPAFVRFKDAGSAVLNAFRTQAAVAVTQPPLPQNVDHHFSLHIVTVSGKNVELDLASRNNELMVRIDADTELSDVERNAVADLAKGFQAAIDGMTMDVPQLRLGELSNFTGDMLRSIDLHAAVSLSTTPPSTQTLDFHIDRTQRSVSVYGCAGELDISVRTDKPEALGTRQQQEKAITSYLKQFDQAAARGHGDRYLMTMFKDAFLDLSRTANRDDLDTPRVKTAAGAWTLSREDHSVLTGLADFSASVTQTPLWNNPARGDEVSGFQYRASQETYTGGASWADRSIEQVQQSRLNAQFHEALQGGDKTDFDYSSKSQNYRYHQIEDSAQSNVSLKYKDGELRKASLEQSVTQSERIREYVQGKMMSDTTIPVKQRLVRDLIAVLALYQAEQGHKPGEESREAKEERREKALQELNDKIFL